MSNSLATPCMDCSPPGSSVHGILQARILEWVAMPSSKGSPWSRDWTHVSCTAGRFITPEPPGKSHIILKCSENFFARADLCISNPTSSPPSSLFFPFQGKFSGFYKYNHHAANHRKEKSKRLPVSSLEHLTVTAAREHVSCPCQAHLPPAATVLFWEQDSCSVSLET